MVTLEAVQIIVGVAIFGAVALPRVLSDQPLSFPIVYVLAGMALFTVPGSAAPPDPIVQSTATEHLTEFVVIVALMGAGLKLDRPFSRRAWSSTWRLLGITMPITILLTTLLGLWVVGALAGTAILFGAVVAPTDPVLASEVQASPPTEAVDTGLDSAEQEGDVRFALTSEAGLNDGLAFPFTHLAIVVAAAGSEPLATFAEWALIDVVQKIAVGVVVGYVAGTLLARFLFRYPSISSYSQVMEGAEALAVTLVTYGVAELAHGYGFIAVFVAALELRHYEWEHDYHRELHDFAVMTERLTMALVLVLFGGAIVGGLLAPLSWLDVAVALTVVFVVRPVAGIVGLLGSSVSWGERIVVSVFGIRGIGSFFYLSYALNEASFRERELLYAADKLWALVGLVVLLSIVVHGVAATPVMRVLDRIRGGDRGEAG